MEDWIWKVQDTRYDCDEAKTLREASKEASEREFWEHYDEERNFIMVNNIAKTFTPKNCSEKLKNMSIDEQYNFIQNLVYRDEYQFIYDNIHEEVKNQLKRDEETTRAKFDDFLSRLCAN
jgi:hypothetical protein